MNEPSTTKSRLPVFAMLIAAFLSGNSFAQTPTISVVSKNVGPIGISDLHVLLGDDLQFQIFDFEAEEDFCLVLGYTHEIDGQEQRRGPFDQVVCNVAGPQRLIVVMRPAGENRRLSFGLHDRNTGAGATRTAADFPIEADIGGATFFRVEEIIRFNEESTLIRLQFGRNPPDPGPRHKIRILVRLDKNDMGIRSYSKPSD